MAPDTDGVSQTTFQHSYSDIGHYDQTSKFATSNGRIDSTNRTIAVIPDFAEVDSTRSGPMWLDEQARRLWVVNPTTTASQSST